MAAGRRGDALIRMRIGGLPGGGCCPVAPVAARRWRQRRLRGQQRSSEAKREVKYISSVYKLRCFLKDYWRASAEGNCICSLVRRIPNKDPAGRLFVCEGGGGITHAGGSAAWRITKERLGWRVVGGGKDSVVARA
ncbi:hypothetical protein E2C01_029176 [Portunus trituberculatus]|uniref:Uncharacterized protein n=1 Tax=Portunus trituberculatus TaxID=210409 RepID=A0A5B7ENG5_PORTR|nr:hypothetical protein [Portunus trituberculatus]